MSRRDSSPSAGLPLEESPDELRGVERLEVFYLFSDADIPDRNSQFLLNAHDYASLRGTIEFGEYDTANIRCFLENAGLLKAVLSGRSIQHQKSFVGGIRLFAGNYAANLFQFLD